MPLFFIPQLAVVPEHNIFLGLSDGVVFYADLEHFHLLGHLSRSKGASYFAVDWQKLRAHDVEFRSELRICVGTRNKLQLYNYRRSVFVWKVRWKFEVPPTDMHACSYPACMVKQSVFFICLSVCLVKIFRISTFTGLDNCYVLQ